MTKEEKVLEIIERLKPVYPDAKIELNFKNPFQLLVATILAAQSTDVAVNKSTPQIFKKYPTPEKLANAQLEDADSYVTNILFHKNKMRNIIKASQVIVSSFGGIVPESMEELITLPGVARKTANVILTCAFNNPYGIIIDTHMIRLSNKLGLTDEKDPIKIEQDLMKIVPKQHWKDFPLMLILHGRYVCKAKAHSCENCPLGDLCPDSK